MLQTLPGVHTGAGTMGTVTPAQARKKAHELREQAMKEASASLRYELRQIADHYEALAEALEQADEAG